MQWFAGEGQATAFRRDFGRLSAAVRAPGVDRARGAQLQEHWDFVSDQLHHHHRVEDETLWPLVRPKLEGRQAQLAVLDTMETAGVDPDVSYDMSVALSEACANVVQHAGPGEEYEVRVSARDRRCTIEVVNTGNGDGESAPAGFALTDEPVPVTAEHGRGLKIIEAVVDNLQLTGNGRQGTTVHFEKTLEWVPGAAGQHLFSSDVEGSDPAVGVI